MGKIFLMSVVADFIGSMWGWGRFDTEDPKEANRRFQMRGIN